LIDDEEGELVRSIGLDVHRDFCEVAIVEAGEVRSAGRIETTPATLELFAQSLCSADRVALEVTGNAWEIARILEPHVGEVLVVHPGDTGIRQARAKTDRLDARALAKLLAAGSLHGLWDPPQPKRAVRRVRSTGCGCPTSRRARCGGGWRGGPSSSRRGRVRRTSATPCWSGG